MSASVSFQIRPLLACVYGSDAQSFRRFSSPLSGSPAVCHLSYSRPPCRQRYCAVIIAALTRPSTSAATAATAGGIGQGWRSVSGDTASALHRYRGAQVCRSAPAVVAATVVIRSYFPRAASPPFATATAVRIIAWRTYCSWSAATGV